MTPQGILEWLKRIDKTGLPLLVARIILIYVFLYMAWDKIIHPVNFLKLTHEYAILPETPPQFLTLTAVIVPWLEVVCALCLLFGVFVRGTGFTLLGLMIFFTGMVTYRAVGIYFAGDISFCSIEFDCGCGAGVVKICHKIPENIALTFLSAIVAFSQSRLLCGSRLFWWILPPVLRFFGYLPKTVTSPVDGTGMQDR